MYYFDNAATTFQKPDIVLDTYMKASREAAANPGRSGHRLAKAAGLGIYEVREKIAQFFNIKNPMQIAFTSNGTEALNMGIKGVLKAGDHVITTSMEHNSVLRPIHKLKDQGIEVSIIDCNHQGCIDLDKIEAAIQPNSKMIVTTHASNLTGTLMPIQAIGELAQRYELLYMVDGAQTAGVFPIDVQKMHIDILAVTGHKSLFGPQGTGFIYVKESLQLDSIKEGGTGSKSYEMVQPLLMPDLLESGTPNTPGIIALGAGIDFIQAEGLEKIYSHEYHLTQKFIEGLALMPTVKYYGVESGVPRAPVVALNIGKEDSSMISYYLDDEYDIATRPGLHCAPLAHETIGTFEQGCVRFSFGYFNTEAEIDYALKAIQEIVKKYT